MTPAVKVLKASAEGGRPFRSGSLVFQPKSAKLVLSFLDELPTVARAWAEVQTPMRLVFMAEADASEPPARKRERRRPADEAPAGPKEALWT
jgi:hypothetical protein